MQNAVDGDATNQEQDEIGETGDIIEAKTDKPAKSKRVSVSVKLYLAFGAVAATTIAAGAVGLLSFGNIQGVFTNVVGNNVPQMAVAQELSRQSAMLTALAPSLAGASSAEEGEAVQGQLAERLAEISKDIDLLAQSGTPEETLNEVRQQVGGLEANLSELGDIVQQRINRAEVLAGKVAEANQLQEKLNKEIEPRSEEARKALLKGSAGVSIEAVTTLGAVVNGPMKRLEALMVLSRVPRLMVAQATGQGAGGEDIQALTDQLTKSREFLSKQGDLGGLPEGISAALDEIGDGTSPGAVVKLVELDALLAPEMQKAYQESAQAVQIFPGGNAGRVSKLVNTDMAVLQTFLRIQAMANKVSGLLATAANVNEIDRLAPLSEELAKSLRQLEFQIGEMKDEDSKKALLALAAKLVELGEGNGNIVDLRRAGLEGQARADATVEQTRQASDRLANAVDQIVSQASGQVDTGTEDVAKAFNNGFLLLAVIMCGSLVFTGLVMWLYINRRLVARLDRLTKSTEAVSNGQLDAEIDNKGNDELADMANSLLVFRDALKETEAAERKLEESRQRAKERQEKLMNDTANEFEKSVGGMVENLATAARKLQETATAMSNTAESTQQEAESVAAASEETSASMQVVSSSTEQMSASIRKISEQVTNASQFARTADDRVKTTNEQVVSLADAASKIGEVVSLITDIAEQTNLLALNATIEAARAGDAGKGFAVVANEVKSLATQTQKATDDISAHIERVQNETRVAVDAVQEVGDVVKEISNINQSVAGAMDEQNSSTNEIAQNVSDTASGSREVSRTIQNINQAAGETGEASTQVLEAANQLLENSQGLEKEIEKFLVNIRSGN